MSRAAFVFLFLPTIPHVVEARASEEQQRDLCRFVKITPGLLIRFIRAIRRGDGFRQAVHSGTRSSRMGLFLRYTNLQSGGKPWSISATRTKAPSIVPPET